MLLHPRWNTFWSKSRDLTQINLLQLRSRSLVVADWNQNLEIHDAIYEIIAKKHGTVAKRE